MLTFWIIPKQYYDKLTLLYCTLIPLRYGTRVYEDLCIYYAGVALKYVYDKLSSSDSGMRRNVPKVIVAVTDGRSQDEVQKNAAKLQHAGKTLVLCRELKLPNYSLGYGKILDMNKVNISLNSINY